MNNSIEVAREGKHSKAESRRSMSQGQIYHSPFACDNKCLLDL